MTLPNQVVTRSVFWRALTWVVLAGLLIVVIPTAIGMWVGFRRLSDQNRRLEAQTHALRQEIAKRTAADARIARQRRADFSRTDLLICQREAETRRILQRIIRDSAHVDRGLLRELPPALVERLAENAQRRAQAEIEALRSKPCSKLPSQ